MTKLEMLFVRACKAGDYSDRRTHYTRIESVYRRFYLDDEINRVALISILGDICEKYNLISIMQMLTRLDPNYVFAGDEEYDYIERCYQTLVSTIRLTLSTQFDNLIRPRRFR